MLSLPPIIKPLLRKKLMVSLLGLQIALVTMLLGNIMHMLNEEEKYYQDPSGIDDKYLLCFTLRTPAEMKGIMLADGLRDFEKIKNLPGVVDIASINAIPFDHDNQLKPGTFTTALEKHTERIPFSRGNVSPNTINTLGLRLLAGRHFENSDMAFTYKDEPRVIIITQTLARALFGENNNAIGKVVYENDKQYEIIGVTSDWRGFSPQIYSSESTAFFPEYNEFGKDFRYLIRTVSPEVRDEVILTIQKYLFDQYPQGLIYYADKLDDVITKFKSSSTFSLLTLITLVLTIASIIAIAGQAYFSVNQRRKQLGVLRALGATRKQLILQILLENAVIILIGLELGAALSMALSHLLYQASNIAPISLWFLLGTAGVFFTVCLLGAAVPAWQAGRISPSLATRTL